MKKYNNVPWPFEKVKEYTKSYPDCWEWCDFIHEKKGMDGLPKWDDICEIPISATLSIMNKYENADARYFPAELAGLYAWRKYKEIYSFDEDLAEMLMAQNDDIVVPIEALQNLPYPCIYIQLSKDDGYFVWIEDDINTHILELRFLYYENRKLVGNFILHLKDEWTISEGVIDAVETAEANIKNDEIMKNAEKYGIKPNRDQEFSYEYIEWYRYMISELLQPVLYICADNKEIEEDKEIVRRAKPTNKPKDVFREIRKWDVGYRVGNAIRKSKSNSNWTGANAGTGSSKRPHTRRGHWHHFWRGHRDNKEVVLKWIAPMFINGNSDDIIPTEHKVK